MKPSFAQPKNISEDQTSNPIFFFFEPGYCLFLHLAYLLPKCTHPTTVPVSVHLNPDHMAGNWKIVSTWCSCCNRCLLPTLTFSWPSFTAVFKLKWFDIQWILPQAPSGALYVNVIIFVDTNLQFGKRPCISNFYNHHKLVQCLCVYFPPWALSTHSWNQSRNASRFLSSSFPFFPHYITLLILITSCPNGLI